MSATDFRKMVMVQNGNRFIGIECSDGEHVTLMIEGMQGWSPRLSLDDINTVMDALADAAQVIRGA